jgi:hypothetical protein
MNTHTTTTFDASKLSARDRHAYELGMVVVERKLAAAKLAAIRRREAPQSFRMVPTSAKKFEAGQPVKRSGRMTTHVVFSTLGE